MTAVQLAILAGGAAGLGATLIIARLLPAHPDLRSVMDRLDPARAAASARAVSTLPTSSTGASVGVVDRLGGWVQRRGPGLLWDRAPHRELAMLRIPAHRYLGEKALYAAIGLVFPLLATSLLMLLGIRLPFSVPAGAAVLLAAAMSFLPDYNARDDAAKARRQFLRALGAYIDLVALERHAGAGSTQALEMAAQVGDSWVFRRIREELARARWAGHPPWDGLARLAEELALPEINDLADIMRLSAEEGATVYTTLRARAAALRAALLSEEHTKANAAEERMTFPVTMLAFLFLLLVSAPAILRILLGGAS